MKSRGRFTKETIPDEVNVAAPIAAEQDDANRAGADGHLKGREKTLRRLVASRGGGNRAAAGNGLSGGSTGGNGAGDRLPGPNGDGQEEFVGEENQGEMVVVTDKGVESVQIEPSKTKVDIFEFVYFARPDSNILGKSVYEVRKNAGIKLAEECPIKADIIVPVPETAMPVASGYSAKLGIPMEMALVKNRYIHRTFIAPEQHTRDLGVRLKLTPLTEMLKGKKIVVMDDSIVRGTTSRQLVKMLFEAGCVEVHMLISSPPVKFPDFYGIDTPEQKDLIASHKTVEEIRQYLGATSLYFLSLKGLIESIGVPESTLCTSCFTGDYPIDLMERATEVKQPVYASNVKPEGTLF